MDVFSNDKKDMYLCGVLVKLLENKKQHDVHGDFFNVDIFSLQHTLGKYIQQ